MARLRGWCLAGLVVGLWTLAAPAVDKPADTEVFSDERPLLLGMVPVWSPSAQFTRLGLLRSQVSASLQRDVQLVSAPDLPEFLRRVANGYYDIVYIAPHFVSGALDSGLYRLAAVASEHKTALVVVRASDPVAGLDALASGTVLTGPEKALVTMVGKQMLARAGLIGQRQPRYRTMANMQAVLDSLASGQGDAAVVGSLMEKDVSARALRIVQRSEPFPGVAILVSSALGDNELQRLQHLFLGLSTDGDGRRALDALGVAGLRKGRRADYDALRSAYPGEDN